MNEMTGDFFHHVCRRCFPFKDFSTKFHEHQTRVDASSFSTHISGIGGPGQVGDYDAPAAAKHLAKAHLDEVSCTSSKQNVPIHFGAGEALQGLTELADAHPCREARVARLKGLRPIVPAVVEELL